MNDGKNKHLDHLEELLIMGVISPKKTIEILETMLAYAENRHIVTNNSRVTARSVVHATIKFDGSPAVFFGKHPETGEFIISTKSLFNKTPKYARTIAEIDSIFHKGPVKQLTHLYHILSGLEFDGIYQGDILFTPDNLKKTPSGVEFCSNTLVYKYYGDEAKKIQQHVCGLLVHTKYDGKTINDLSASFLDTPMSLDGVWSPDIHHFKDVSIFSESSRNSAKTLIHNLSKCNVRCDLTEQQTRIFNTMINGYLRSNRSFPSIDEISKGVAQFNDTVSLSNSFICFYRDVVSCKNRIIKALDDCAESDYLKIFVNDNKEKHYLSHEGYVVQFEDVSFKLVNRAKFSALNFTIKKPWENEKK